MTYEHLMNMTDNPQILEPLYFLREREVVHFQRFGECLEIVQGRQNARPQPDIKIGYLPQEPQLPVKQKRSDGKISKAPGLPGAFLYLGACDRHVLSYG